MNGILYFLLGTQASNVPPNNILLFMFALGGAGILSIVLIGGWVLAYRFFPGKVASPYPNLYLGEDPHKKGKD